MAKSKKNNKGQKSLGVKNTKKNSSLLIGAVVAIPLVLVIIVFAIYLSQPDKTNLNGNIIGDGIVNNGNEDNANRKPVVKDADLVIQINEITTDVTFYPIEVDGVELEVFAVEASDGTIRTAFNTCQICYSSGRGYYVQRDDVLVCRNCGNQYKMDDVEVTRGGCNPVPITGEDKTVDDTSIVIKKDFLVESKEIFSNWK